MRATAYASRLAPAVTLIAPPRSKPRQPRRAAAPSRGSTRSAASTTTAPTGTLTRKIHRQPAAETSTPPRMSPSVPAAADAPPQTANARLRAGPAGNTAASIANVIGTTNAAASPSAARVTIMTAADGASAEPSEAAANSPVPASSTRRRPSRSPVRPPNSRNPPNGTMYASTIHASPPSEKCSEFLIAGIATLTTVTSIVSSSAARHSTTSASTCPRVQVNAAEPAETPTD